MTRIKSKSLFEGMDIEVSSEIIESLGMELQEELIFLNRVAKVVKGGRRFSFCALIVVGDQKGHVGVGYGKANQVPDAIRKGVEDAKKNLFRVPLIGRTIPHEVTGIFGAARVLLKPASEGTGIIAGPAARAVVSLAGIKDILTKCLGTDTALNVVKATVAGLRSLQDPERIAERRNKSLEDLIGKKKAELYIQTKSTVRESVDKPLQSVASISKDMPASESGDNQNSSDSVSEHEKKNEEYSDDK